MVISDDHLGLKHAIAAVLPGAGWQLSARHTRPRTAAGPRHPSAPAHRRQHLSEPVRMRLLELLAQPGGYVPIHNWVGHRFLSSVGVVVRKGDRWSSSIREGSPLLVHHVPGR
ncbi:MAG: hypothetical protein DLM67_07075 [Candidatus Nephthysia bennettiae]|nr:MAG: hypothetical protein DLM67_07075 [Candidatus Dormibacteraeota bacterium]